VPMSRPPLSEFDLIERFFGARFAQQGGRALAHAESLGIGDDAAILAPIPVGEQLVVSADMLVEGRHYFPECDPQSLGHKVLAVNLSDLAAMGARPLGFTLSMGLRAPREAWLTSFSEGLYELASDTGCALLGGDTVAVPSEAPEVFSVSVLGTVPLGRALRRDGVCPGDQIWVSGHLGDGLEAVRRRLAHLRLDRPTPRLALGEALREWAHAAIDVSDGLTAELRHLLTASRRRSGQPLVAHLSLDALEACLGPLLKEAVAGKRLSPREAARVAAVSGDEYELLFAAPSEHGPHIEERAKALHLPVTCLGSVCVGPGEDLLHWHDSKGQPIPAHEAPGESFDHFRTPTAP